MNLIQDNLKFVSLQLNVLLRKISNPIHYGKTMHFIHYNNVYSYFRYDENNAVLVIINASDKPVEIEWQRYDEITTDLLEGHSVLDDKRVKIGDIITVESYESKVFEFSKK